MQARPRAPTPNATKSCPRCQESKEKATSNKPTSRPLLAVVWTRIRRQRSPKSKSYEVISASRFHRLILGRVRPCSGDIYQIWGDFDQCSREFGHNRGKSTNSGARSRHPHCGRCRWRLIRVLRRSPPAAQARRICRCGAGTLLSLGACAGGQLREARRPIQDRSEGRSERRAFMGRPALICTARRMSFGTNMIR